MPLAPDILFSVDAALFHVTSVGGSRGHVFCFVFFSQLFPYISHNWKTPYHTLILGGAPFSPKQIFLWILLCLQLYPHFSSHRCEVLK